MEKAITSPQQVGQPFRVYSSNSACEHTSNRPQVPHVSKRRTTAGGGGGVGSGTT
jgi:hypothetical protein